MSFVRDPGARARDRAACADAGAPFISVADTVRDRTAQRRALRSVVRRRHAGRPLRHLAARAGRLPAGERRDRDSRARAAGRPTCGRSRDAIESGLGAHRDPRPHGVLPVASGRASSTSRTTPTRPQHLRAALRGDVSRPALRVRDGGRRIEGRARGHRAVRRARRARSCSRRSRRPGATASRPQRLASIAGDLGAWGRAITDPVEAFCDRAAQRRRRHIIVVTGSTFIVAELREWWMANVQLELCLTSARPRGALRVRGRVLPWGARTYVMGIVNVSPDSFSGDGDPRRRRRGRARALAQLARRRRPRRRRRRVDAPGPSARSTTRPSARVCCRRSPRSAPRRPTRSSRSTRSSRTFSRDAHAAGGDLLNSIWGATDATDRRLRRDGRADRRDAQQGRRGLRARRRRRGARHPRRRGGALRSRAASRPSTSSSIPASGSASCPNTTSPCCARSTASSRSAFRRWSAPRANPRSAS